MAWNEPGNNGEKDPWGSRQDQGPPDLDEAFKKLKENLGGMFGGGSGAGGASAGGGGLKSSLVAIVLGVLAIGYGFMGKVHSHAWRSVNHFFPDAPKVEMSVICGRSKEALEAARVTFGWNEAETDCFQFIELQSKTNAALVK